MGLGTIRRGGSWPAIASAAALALASQGCGLDEPVSGLCDIALTTATNAGRAINGSGFGNSLAQSFEATSDDTLTTVKLALARTGNPNGNIVVSIQADSGGLPSGTDLSSATATEASADISATESFVSFTLSSPVSVSDGTTYWIIAKATYGNSDTANINWRGFSTDAYAGGDAGRKTLAGTFELDTAPLDYAFQVGCDD